MRKVLIANIFGIGDVLFTTPIVSSIRKEFPGVSVGYLCNGRTREVVKSIPGVDEIFVYEKDHYVTLWRKSRIQCLKSLWQLFGKMRGRKYDTVFDFTMSREFGAFFAFAGIPRRIGFDYKRRGIFLTDKFPISGFKGKHVIEHYLGLLETIGVAAGEKRMLLVPDARMDGWAESYLESKNLTGKSFAAVIPGGGASWGKHASRKRWGAEGFAETASRLEEKAIKTVILGDSSEKELCDKVASLMESSPAAVENGLSISEYMSVLKRAGIVLCNDGGPLHMAVALGVKTVSIFGPVNENVYGPYPAGEKHRVITAEGLSCRPCYDRFKLPECGFEHRCVTDIAPVKVANACLELIKVYFSEHRP
jgi:ADP-heptose:LPS heptosyltransferase